MIGGLIQLISRGIEDSKFTVNPEITYFKYAYKSIGLFYKNENSLNNINVNWNTPYIFNVKKDIDLLGEMYVKVKIPYFQLKEINVIESENSISNDIITKVLYDSYDTFLFIYNYNNELTYYLIPSFLLNNSFSKYSTNIIKFSEISKYFHQVLVDSLPLDTNIHFLSFTNMEFISEIIPIILKFGNILDQYYVNQISESNDLQMNTNLLNQNSYDNYLSSKVKNALFKNFQFNFQFDDLYEIRDILSDELIFYYDYYLNNIFTYENENLDLIKSLRYYRDNNFLISEEDFLKNTIKKNSLFLKYFLDNIHNTFNKIYTFYKKFPLIVLSNIPYKITLHHSQFIPINSNGENIDGTNILNNISPGYPLLKIREDSKSIFTSNMIIKDLIGNPVSYDSSTGIFIIELPQGSNPFYANSNIIFEIIDPNRTENNINENIIINEFNNISEWESNIFSGVEVLSNDSSIESLVFDDFKINYYLQENSIKNDYKDIVLSNEDTKKLWIDLRTIEQKFKNSDYIYTNVEDLSFDKQNIESKYHSIKEINKLPQDLFNIYVLIINNFIINISNKYFTDETFIKFWYNKLINFFYMRFINISNINENILQNDTIIFYTNYDINYYISKNIMLDYLKELFHLGTFIGFVPLDSNELKGLNSFNLEYNSILSYINPLENSTSKQLDNTNYFQSLRIEVKYRIKTSDYKIEDNKLILNKNIFYTFFYKDGLTNFILEFGNGKFYNIESYELNNSNFILKLNNIIDKPNDFILIQKTIISLPYINLSISETDNLFNDYENQIENIQGEKIESHKITLFNKIKKINKFNNYTNIQVNLDKTKLNNYYFFILYSLDKEIINYPIELKRLDNGYYEIIPINNNEIPKNFDNYDNIELDYVELPIKKIEIIDQNCVENMQNTIPLIKIKKSYLIENDLLEYFTQVNSFNSIINGENYELRLEGEDIYIDNETNDEINIIVLQVITSSPIELDFFLVNSKFIQILKLDIFENKYLPNLYHYSSIPNSYSNPTMLYGTNDYILQKPMLLKLNSNDINTGDKIPLFLFCNIPDFTTSEKYSSELDDSIKYYLNNRLVTFKNNNLFKINSNQLIREKDNLSIKYSNYFDKNIIKQTTDLDNIKNLIEAEFISLFNTDTLNGKIINIIEKSYSSKISSYIDIINDIESSNIYGDSIKKIFNLSQDLNIFTTLSSLNSFKLNIKNYKLVDYDGFTIFSLPFYDSITNNLNNYKLNFNDILLDNFLFKYNYSNKLILKSPWINFNSSFRLSTNLKKFLERLSIFVNYQIEYIENNIDINILCNKSNFKQNYSSQSFFKNNYIKNLYEIKNANIKLQNKSIFNEFITESGKDITVDVYYNDRKLDNIEFNKDTNIISCSYNNSLNYYDDTTFIKEKINTNNNYKLSDKYYNLIGYINKTTINNNPVFKLNNIFSENYNDLTHYLIQDLVYDKDYFLKNYYLFVTPINNGVNNNIYSLKMNESLTYPWNFEEGFYNIKKYIYLLSFDISNLAEFTFIKNQVKYYVTINNSTGLLIRTNNKIKIFSNLQVKLYSVIKILLFETTDESNIIINRIINNKSVPFTDFFNLNTEFITNISFQFFNWYNKNKELLSKVMAYQNNFIIELPNSNTSQWKETDSLTNTIIKNQSNDWTLSNTFGVAEAFLDDIILLNASNNNMEISDTLSYTIHIVPVIKTLEPPIIISNNNSINIFNISDELNWFENSEHWIKINNNELKIKDLYESNISDGSYLLYYCPSNNKPNTLFYLDLYYPDIPLPTNFINYDPYINKYIIKKSFSQIESLTNYFNSEVNLKTYSYYVNGTYNGITGYYYPLSTESLGNDNTYTFTEYPNTTFYSQFLNFSETITSDFTNLSLFHSHDGINQDDHHRKVTEKLIIKENNKVHPIIKIQPEIHTHMMGNMLEVTSALIPNVDFTVSELFNGYNLNLILTNFTLSFNNVSEEHISNEGHVHLYINGVKKGRIYEENTFLDLEEGNNQIKVVLNSNDHQTLIYNGDPLQRIDTTFTSNIRTIFPLTTIQYNTAEKPEIEIKIKKDKMMGYSLEILLENFTLRTPTGTDIPGVGFIQLEIENKGKIKKSILYNYFSYLDLDYGINVITATLVTNDNKIITDNNINISTSLTEERDGKISLICSDKVFYETSLSYKTINNLFYSRPLIITNKKPYFEYSYENSDSLFIIKTGTGSYSLPKLILQEKHIESNIFIDSNNDNIIVTKKNIREWELTINDLSNFEATNNLNNINLYKIILDIYHLEDNIKIDPEKIIFYFIISDIYPDNNILIKNTITNSQSMIIEPLYLNVDEVKLFFLDDISESDLSNADSNYFNFIFPTNTDLKYYYSDIIQSQSFMLSKTLGDFIISNYNIYTDKISSLNEITGEYTAKNLVTTKIISNPIKIKQNINKNISSHLNLWDYLESITLDEDNITENVDIIKNFKYFIFIENNKLYYNELKIIDSESLSIKLLYKYSLRNIDLLIYNFEPFFINSPISIYQDYHDIFIYCEYGNFERNEIIKIEGNVIRILNYSNLNSAYFGEIIIPTIEIHFSYLNYKGYYSLGKLNNYLDRNYILKNFNDTNTLTKLESKNELIYGDYFINNPNLSDSRQAILFTNQNFEGQILQLSEGLHYLTDYPNFLNRISSIKTNELLIYLYDEVINNEINFASELVLTESSTDLNNFDLNETLTWNNKARAILITQLHGFFYTNEDFTGNILKLSVGNYLSTQLNDLGILNQVVSLKTNGLVITLFDQDNFQGNSIVIEENISNTSQLSTLIDWSTNLKSVKISRKQKDLDIYKDNKIGISDKVFKFNKGTYFYILCSKENGINEYYYDPSLVTLKEDYILYYKDSNDNYYSLIINNVNNNEISFVYSNLPSSIKDGEAILVYLPLIPFDKKQIMINVTINGDEKILDIDGKQNFTGWIQDYSNSQAVIYKVINSKNKARLLDDLASGLYNILDINNFTFIPIDFTNNYLIENSDLTTNDSIPLKFNLKIGLDDYDYGVYFYQNGEYDFSNLNVAYNQYILVNDITYKIRKITINRIYINFDVQNLKIKFNEDVFYSVIISAGNLLNNFTSLNNYVINDSYKFDLPDVKTGQYNVNILFHTHFTENNVDFSNVFNYEILNCSILKLDTTNYRIVSSELTNLINSNIWDENVYKWFYLNNYIPFVLTDDVNLTIRFDLSPLLPTLSNSRFHILLEEIYKEERYLHYIDAILVNNNIIKVTSNNNYKSLDDSKFYLNRVIPVRITKNSYMQILSPEVIENSFVNNKNKEYLKYYIKFNFNNFITDTSLPTKQNSRWKYEINISEEKFLLLKNKKVYYSENILDNNYIIKENNKYFLLTENFIRSKINYIFIIKDNYIESIIFPEKEIKSKFSKIEDGELIDFINEDVKTNNYKVESTINLDYSEAFYNMSFKTNQPSLNNFDNKAAYPGRAKVVNFGNIFGDFYFNKRNKISDFNIRNLKADNELNNLLVKYNFTLIGNDSYSGFIYNISSKYPLYDISSNLQQKQLYKDVKNNDSFRKNKIEISTTVTSMYEFLKEKGIDLNLLLNNTKPWKLWSQVTLSNNEIFDNILIKDKLVYVNKTLVEERFFNSDLNFKP